MYILGKFAIKIYWNDVELMYLNMETQFKQKFDLNVNYLMNKRLIWFG